MAIPDDPTSPTLFRGRYGAFTFTPAGPIDAPGVGIEHLVCAADWNAKVGGDMIDGTTFCSGALKQWLTGIDEFEVSCSGFYNAAAGWSPYNVAAPGGGGQIPRMRRGLFGDIFLMLGVVGGDLPAAEDTPLGWSARMTVVECGSKISVKDLGAFDFSLRSFGGQLSYPVW